MKEKKKAEAVCISTVDGRLCALCGEASPPISPCPEKRRIQQEASVASVDRAVRGVSKKPI